MAIDEAEIQTLLDKQAITEQLHRYCRAVDRKDRKLLESVYWPEATDDHILYAGPVSGFIDFAFRSHAGLTTQHSLGNVLIEMIDSRHARAGSYFHAYHERRLDDGCEEHIVGGRYIDRWEKRDREWRMIERGCALDYCVSGKRPDATKSERYKNMPLNGRKFPDDPVYQLFR